ncbi:OmpA family protein [Oceanobacillus bengalensis]|uniref:OmpA family protein n=1 Tax=Oceanobacillus bengalensis TaxID=1435466 RepID=A0A494YR47_9BACI|nr:OmpA family protein [Oceanobacillus bengalensis]RKQ11506.1 OmpA family protein [Oceanobacillus bengalensis]
MQRKVYLFFFLLFSLVFIVGCNTEAGTDDVDLDGQETTGIDEENDEDEKQEKVEEPETAKQPENAEQHIQDENETGEKTTTTPDENKTDPDRNLGDYEVFLGGEMTETDEFIIIKGATNILPGSRVIGQVTVGEKDEEEYFQDTTELVQDDGTFYMEIPHHDLKKETKVEVMFHFDGHQDNEMIRHYGDRGQELVGPYVYKHQGKVGGGSPQNIFQMAKVETSFVPGEDKAVRQFKEPDWYPIPEDMGDPRVWIEVEEINNGENYFYLHGRSNLLEGSILSGKYSGKSDNVSVKPDGSFDMVFEYEYDEDASFVIEFDPAHWGQWNIIKETYGAKGQKLVGDLVVQNKYNDNQTIIKEERLESTEINVPDNVELTIDGAEVMMLVPDNLLFDFDKYELREESKDLLTEIGETLQSFDKVKEIEVSGHTDSNGDEKYNLDLSQKRADEVKAFLTELGNLAEKSINTVGYGEAKPIASNDNETGQAKNRRVEIIINLR